MDERGTCRLEVRIPCPEGDLAGNLLYDGLEQPGSGVVIFPPHPLLAGNMENNVVEAVAGRCVEKRLTVLLFNYRAVGTSFNPRPELPLFEFWNDLDNRRDFSQIIADCRSVMSYSRRFMKSVGLVGYSFGAFLASQCIDESVSCFAAIAPPLAEHDFSCLGRTAIPTMLLHAGEDSLLGSGITKKSAAISELSVADTDHFFLGREDEVAVLLAEFLCAE